MAALRTSWALLFVYGRNKVLCKLIPLCVSLCERELIANKAANGPHSNISQFFLCHLTSHFQLFCLFFHFFFLFYFLVSILLSLVPSCVQILFTSLSIQPWWLNSCQLSTSVYIYFKQNGNEISCKQKITINWLTS